MLRNRNGQDTFRSLKGIVLPALRHLFLHNGWIKLAAVLISIILWAGLISQDTSLTRDKYFNDVSVNITGIDTAKRNGFIVTSNLDEILNGVNVVAAVPQQQYENADVSVYNVRLDLSKINGTGQQEIKLQSNVSATYGRVSSINPASVTVNVEEYTARYRIPVSVSSENGQKPANWYSGWYMSTPSVDPPLITVSGPQSLVNTISRGRAILNTEDIDWTEGSSLISLPLKIYNRAGEDIQSDLLEVTYDNVPVDSVIVEQTILPTKTFDVTDMITTTGNVGLGYEIKSIRISPETITVAARSEILEQMSEPILQQRKVNVKNLKETATFQIKVSKPSDEAVLSADTITVVVEIGQQEGEH